MLHHYRVMCMQVSSDKVLINPQQYRALVGPEGIWYFIVQYLTLLPLYVCVQHRTTRGPESLILQCAFPTTAINHQFSEHTLSGLPLLLFV